MQGHVNFQFFLEGYIDITSVLSEFFHILFYPQKSQDNRLRQESNHLKYCFYFTWISGKVIFAELKCIKQISENNCFLPVGSA